MDRALDVHPLDTTSPLHTGHARHDPDGRQHLFLSLLCVSRYRMSDTGSVDDVVTRRRRLLIDRRRALITAGQIQHVHRHLHEIMGPTCEIHLAQHVVVFLPGRDLESIDEMVHVIPFRRRPSLPHRFQGTANMAEVLCAHQ